MQYTPLVLLNDEGLLANQRLYNVQPREGVSDLALAAVLNSTVFACERYAAVKALGREAAIDVEVFSARAFLTPDVTAFPANIVDELEETMRVMIQREVGPFLEEALLRAGHSEAKSYINRHPVTKDIWPAELQNATRHKLDRLVLLGLGIEERRVTEIQDRLYNELIEHIRKLRLLELEAQINRRGGSAANDPTPRQLADEIWAELVANQSIEPRMIPEDFVDRSTERLSIFVPHGRLSVGAQSLFDQGRFFCVIGRTRIEFDSEVQMNYVMFLAGLGITGTIEVPFDENACNTALEAMKTYLSDLHEKFSRAASDITGEGELQRRIVREGVRRVTRA